MKYLLRLLIMLICVMCVSAGSEAAAGDLNARYERMPNIEYEGVKYRLRSRLTTVLMAGIDRTAAEAPETGEYRNGGQADFLMLAVIDDANETVQPIHIGRDTMTEIYVVNVMGNISGTRVAQICLAHSFGDGRKQSCELLADAVSKLMLGTPVDEYYVMALDGIAALNDALGGVEVTLNEDLSALDPGMTPGKTMQLSGAQAELFVRHRYGVGDQTDVSRRERQRIYMQAALGVFLERTAEDAGFFTELNNAIEDYVDTGMSRGKIINLGSAVSEYDILPTVEISGENILAETGYMEFYADEDALTQLVIDAFYQPIE